MLCIYYHFSRFTEHNGLIAGLVGFLLIIVYLLWQYRGLAVVAVASLIVAAVTTYLVIALLS